MNLDDGSLSWRNGCENKARYFTQGEAKKIAKTIQRRTGRKMWVYACKHCLGAHITSRPPDRLSPDRNTSV